MEDLASPGEFTWSLSNPGDQAIWMFTAGSVDDRAWTVDEVVASVERTRTAERRRRKAFPTALDRAADAYLVRRGAFVDRFWDERLGRLAVVIDVDHMPGSRDDTFRPNQILAVGGLPMALVDGSRPGELWTQSSSTC